jgi:RNA polymerase sigma-70 factor, ECF subfamily
MKAYSSLSMEELVRRCSSSGEIAAWEEFVHRLQRLIAKVVHRTASRMGESSRQTVDDLIQETYLKLCANDCAILRNFHHRHEGSFVGFVQVVAANVVRDHFKAQSRRTPASGPEWDASREAVTPAPENTSGGRASMEREILMREVSYHLDICTAGPDQARNRTIFWLYYRTGLSAREIAALPGIGLTTKGVESLILRLRKELRLRLATKETAGLEQPGQANEGIRPAEAL